MFLAVMAIWRRAFQSTFPARGATPNLFHASRFHRFNPRSPRGERPLICNTLIPKVQSRVFRECRPAAAACSANLQSLIRNFYQRLRLSRARSGPRQNLQKRERAHRRRADSLLLPCM